MTIFSDLKQIFNFNNINISERLSTVEITDPIRIDVNDLPSSREIKEFYCKIPRRDRFKMIFTSESECDISISNIDFDEEKYTRFIDDLDSDEIVQITINIDKDIQENKFSIYNFDSFSSDLLARSKIEVLKWFSNILRSKQYIVFECFDCDISFSTETIAFISNENYNFTPRIDRIERLKLCRENVSFYNMSEFELIPEDFILHGIEQAENCLKSFLEQMSTIFSLIYISSSSSIVNTDIILNISGYKKTEYKILIDNIIYERRWISLYSWIYTDGNVTDKFLISHNVLSLYCNDKEDLKIDQKILDSIRSNYKLYLKDNVDQYLNLKKDIAKFICDIIGKIDSNVLYIFDNFKKNLIAIFGFMFTVVLSKLSIINSEKGIFTTEILILLEIIFVGSLIYLIICIMESIHRFNKTKEAYEQLKNNYIDVISEDELKDVFDDDKLLKDTNSSVIKGIAIWAMIWATVLIFGVCVLELLANKKGLLALLYNFIINIISRN